MVVVVVVAVVLCCPGVVGLERRVVRQARSDGCAEPSVSCCVGSFVSFVSCRRSTVTGATEGETEPRSEQRHRRFHSAGGEEGRFSSRERSGRRGPGNTRKVTRLRCPPPNTATTVLERGYLSN